MYFASRPAPAGTQDTGWGQPTRFNTTPARLSSRPRLSLDGQGNLYVSWQAESAGQIQSYAASCGPGCGLSVPGVGTWGEVVSLGTITPASRSAQSQGQNVADVRGAGHGLQATDGSFVPWRRSDGVPGCLLLTQAGQ